MKPKHIKKLLLSEMSSEDFEEIDCSLAELAILDDAGLLSVSHGVSPSVIHNTLMIYDGPKYAGNTYDDKSCYKPI